MARDQLSNLAGIRRLVDSFYEKVRADALLGDVFNAVIQNNWPEHLEKMYSFWQTILLSENTYSGNPFFPHSKLLLGKRHFARWLELFTGTVDELFTGDKATEAKWRAVKMAEMFQLKLKDHARIQ